MKFPTVYSELPHKWLMCIIITYIIINGKCSVGKLFIITLFYSLLVIGVSILLGYLAYKLSKKKVTGSVVTVVIALVIPLSLTYPQLFVASIIAIILWFSYVVKEVRV